MERRAAILVIHGIGERRPYEALDTFVQGWRNASASRDLRFAARQDPDLVSGRLDHFDLAPQISMPYLNPLTAHLRYWTDPGFYETVGA